MKIKIFKTKKNFKKGGMHSNPDIFWIFSLSLALATVLAAVIFGFYLFQKVDEELSIPAATNSQIDAVNKEKIDAVLKYFSERQSQSEKIINSPSPIIDPSL